MREACGDKRTQLEEGGRKDNLDRRQPSFGTVRGVAIRSDCLDALARALAHSLNDDPSQTVLFRRCSMHKPSGCLTDVFQDCRVWGSMCVAAAWPCYRAGGCEQGPGV